MKRFVLALLSVLIFLLNTGVAFAAADDIARLYNFTPLTIIPSASVNGEFDQLVNTMNTKFGRGISNTLTGNNTYTGTNTFTHTNGITTNVVTERTSDNGVSVDGLKIKNGYALNPGYRSGCKITYQTANQIKINTPCTVANSTAVDVLTTFGTITVDLSTGGINGVDTGTEAPGWYYIYLIKKVSDGTVSAVASVTNEATGGAITYPAGYTEKRQLPIAIRNDGSSNIIPFIQVDTSNDPLILYSNFETTSTYRVLNAGTATSFTPISTGSLEALIPPVSKLARIQAITAWASAGGAVGFLRTGGNTTTTTGIQVGDINTNVAESSLPPFDIVTDGSQNIDYKMSLSTSNMSVYVEGFTITELSP
jgi:hypothetical protein